MPPVVLPRRSLLAAGLTGLGVIGTLAYLPRSTAYSQQFRPDGELWNAVQTIDIPALSPSLQHDVADATELSSAITTINTTSSAGTHIVLANGSYSSDYTIYAQGTRANPIVIRPANFLGATLTGTLTICGSWVIVRGLNLRTVAFSKVTVGSTTYRANNSRLSRCRMVTSPYLQIAGGASYCCFDRNELANGAGRIVDIHPRGGADNTFRNCFVWNWVYNIGPPPSGRAPVYQINAGSYSLVNMPTELLTAWNRFENCDNPHYIQHKSAENTAIYNTLIGATSFPLTTRTGRRSYFGGNWIEGGQRLNLRGEGHLVVGNYMSTGFIECDRGNIQGGSAQEPSWDSSANGVGWTFAENCELIGNKCSINVLGPNSSQPYAPLRTLIEAHTGSINISSGARETIDRRDIPPSRVVPVAFKLEAHEVGPNS